jgi:DNA-binding GntR family transcriptional regulator
MQQLSWVKFCGLPPTFAYKTAMPLQAVAPVESEAGNTLQEETTRHLRDLIITGSLAPGMRLNERELTERLGVSRTPLREATRRLAAEGLVELLPHRGAIVAHIDETRVRETLQVMGALEAIAGEIACTRATDAEINEIRALHYEMLADRAREDHQNYFARNQAIHFKIIDCAGNAVLSQTYRALNDQVRRVRYQANVNRGRWDQAIAEHEEILAALIARDAARLKEQLAHHLANKMGVVAKSLAALRVAAD